MLPSPSLGPPLLSPSWSPPLPCWMGFAVWAGAVAGGAAGDVTAAWLGGALWCWDELPDGAGAGAAEPDAVSACHCPPNALRPLPVSVPGPVSLTKVYSGCPSKVAWAEPSERLIVPSVPVRPAPAVTGPFTGGQAAAQAPLRSEGVQRVPVEGGLGRAVGALDRAERAGQTRPGGDRPLHRWPGGGAGAVAVRRRHGVRGERVNSETLGVGQHRHAADRGGLQAARGRRDGTAGAGAAAAGRGRA